MRRDTFKKLKNSDKWHYMRNNERKCSKCKEHKKATLFFNYKDKVLEKNCRKCIKKEYEKEVIDIVLNTLSNG